MPGFSIIMRVVYNPCAWWFLQCMNEAVDLMYCKYKQKCYVTTACTRIITYPKWLSIKALYRTDEDVPSNK